MSETSLEQAVLERLKAVIDPETNTNVVRMRLVENLWADALGKVRYTFRPSSFVCPIAVTLAMDIKKAVAEVPGKKACGTSWPRLHIYSKARQSSASVPVQAPVHCDWLGLEYG
jgi:metal-sulfur cluster biosynthetic enzyme